MTTSLHTRIRRLEDANRGGECPRCSGTTITYVNGGLRSLSRYGRRLPPEEAEAFGREEEDGRCPVCGESRLDLEIGWPIDS